ncbi:ATP-binding protein [Saccharothrix luteola]|uniref:ATP-binding protein n=1 Tax=Saccharothrix luteola TaxID=2893018 RepID=UPI001E585F7F|nr:tetratricopeptide repeat protein [Saccharothrix luteola]MCC8245469.1 tetratricopeptide repeat protein [Saccharothrix luteola]
MEDNDIRVQVLGPVALFVDGVEQRLTDRTRALLAALALDRERAVEREQLIELLGGAPGSLTLATIRNYARDLRKLVGSQVLPNKRGRVRLNLDPGHIDYWQFRKLFDRAQSSEGEERRRALREALDLWQPGEPLHNVGQAHLQDQVADLTTRHRKTYLDLITVNLGSGRVDEAVTDAREALSRWPLDGEICGALLQALGHMGDDGEINRIAAEFTERRRKAAQGLPANFTTLVRNALADAGTATKITMARPLRPNQLPRTVETLHGRDHELAQLDWLLAGQARAIAVVGPAGVGKTQLVLFWAHCSLDAFPDGVLYGDLRGFDERDPVPADRLLTSFVRALGAMPTEDPVGQYRSLLAHRAVLVVLDNAPDYEHIEPLLPAGPQCAVVVTSRRRIPAIRSAGSGKEVTVKRLALEAGVAMLRDLIHDRRVKDEWGAARDLVIACGRLPLSITIVAARAEQRKTHRLDRILKDLRDTSALLDAPVPKNRSIKLETVIAWSYRALSPAAADVFRLLGVHPGPVIGAAALSFLTGLPQAELRSWMDELTESHLVEEIEEDRFELLGELRLFAARQAESDLTEEALVAARTRVLDYLFWVGWACDLALESEREFPETSQPLGLTVPEFSRDEAMDWFDAEYGVFTSVLTQPVYRSYESYQWKLSLVLVFYQRQRGHWRDSEKFLTDATETAAHTTEPRYQAVVHRQLGATRRKLNDLNRAVSVLHKSIALEREVGNIVGEAHSHQVLGAIYESRKDMAEATEHYGTALQTYEAVDDRRGITYTASGMAGVLLETGRPEEALTLAQRAVETANDGYGLAAARRTIASCHLELGNPAAAVVPAKQAADEYRRTGAALNEARVCELLGNALARTGDPAGAREAWQRAQDLLVDLLKDLPKPSSDDQDLLARLRQLTAP